MRFHRSRKRRIEKHGIAFDNGSELARYEYLMLRYRAGEITQPEVHPEFRVEINGVYCWSYFADFRYREVNKAYARGYGDFVVEDCKGAYDRVKTQTKKGVIVRQWTERTPILEPLYLVKKKVVEALHGITIKEIWE